MQLNYEGHSQSSGVYQIKNLINGRVYIGSAKCLKVRASQHKRSLEHGCHYNQFLQFDFNKCGSEAFVFEVLEVVDGDKVARCNAEQIWIDKFYGENCYNAAKKACLTRADIPSKNPEATKEKLRQLALNMSVEQREKIAKTLTGRKNGPCSEERKQRISSANKGSKRTPEQKQKMSEAAKKRAPMSEETREKIRANSILMHQKRKGKNEPSDASASPSS